MRSVRAVMKVDRRLIQFRSRQWYSKAQTFQVLDFTERNMRTRQLTMCICGALLLFAPALASAQVADAKTIQKPAASEVTGKISWVFDYTEAQRLSQKSGKPMFVVFRCER